MAFRSEWGHPIKRRNPDLDLECWRAWISSPSSFSELTVVSSSSCTILMTSIREETATRVKACISLRVCCSPGIWILFQPVSGKQWMGCSEGQWRHRFMKGLFTRMCRMKEPRVDNEAPEWPQQKAITSFLVAVGTMEGGSPQTVSCGC